MTNLSCLFSQQKKRWTFWASQLERIIMWLSMSQWLTRQLARPKLSKISTKKTSGGVMFVILVDNNIRYALNELLVWTKSNRTGSTSAKPTICHPFFCIFASFLRRHHPNALSTSAGDDNVSYLTGRECDRVPDCTDNEATITYLLSSSFIRKVGTAGHLITLQSCQILNVATVPVYPCWQSHDAMTV